MFWMNKSPQSSFLTTFPLESKCKTLQKHCMPIRTVILEARRYNSWKTHQIPWIQYITKFVDNSQTADSCFWSSGKQTLCHSTYWYVYSKTNKERELTKLLEVWSRQKHYVLAEFSNHLHFNFLSKASLVSASHHFSWSYAFKTCNTYNYTSFRDKEAELLNKAM